MAALRTTIERQEAQQSQFEAYIQWEGLQMSDPRFMSVRMLHADIHEHGRVMPDTWTRFAVEERTWAAEILNAPHSHVDRFNFDGQDIIVKESDGVQPRLTLRGIYQNGLDKTRADTADEPGLEYQVRRDELFMEFYEDVERMMRGGTDYDTIHVISTCPLPEELSENPAEASRLMELRWYNAERRKSFDYTARRLPDGRLELSATTLDNSNLEAHAKVLQASGYGNVSFAMCKSHDYGAYRSYATTTNWPIEVVIAERAAIYDAELEAQTGRRHRFGRVDDAIDAQEFFREYCEDYWAGYTAYHELLAGHLAGGALQDGLRDYLLRCKELQEAAGRSVLTREKMSRLQIQLHGGHITPDMAMSCRELLVYDHHATLTRLYRQFKETGRVDALTHTGGDLMSAYADAASGNGAIAAANGQTFAGCETATGVTSLTAALQTAGANGLMPEQTFRMLDEEAAHCLRIQLYGYTIRKGVRCPFCKRTVNARDTAETIECLNDSCGTILNKATEEVTVRSGAAESSGERQQDVPEAVRPAPKLHSGQTYTVGSATYRRHLHAVVGGAQVVYTDDDGRDISGFEAERLDAIISRQLSAEIQAA